tara:strand:+ start:122 stop:340 length:219 start_codon:yes stop_codon:yes gene_type:complete
MTKNDSHIVEITVKSDSPPVVQAFIYAYFGEECNVDRNKEATFQLVVKEEEINYELELTQERDNERIDSEFI